MEEKVVLYSTHCPKCTVLEKKLQQKGVKYTEINDISELVERGFKSAPILRIGEQYLEFSDAIKYINSLDK